jgi:hypothetical protein
LQPHRQREQHDEQIAIHSWVSDEDRDGQGGGDQYCLNADRDGQETPPMSTHEGAESAAEECTAQERSDCR